MKKTHSICRRVGAVFGVLALSVGALPASTSTAAAADWPERPVTFVVGFGVAGSADRTARGLATFMADELGQPIKVVNMPGAGSQLAATFVLNQPADGYTVLATSISPYLANSIIQGGAKYKLDDFAYINGQWSDWDIILVNKDRPYKTLVEFLEAVRTEPKKHSVSVVPNSSGHLHALLLTDSVGIPRDSLNIVTYESGGAGRAAVAGGQVDITIQAGEGSEGIREFTRPLAVIRETKVAEWDAPTIDEALKPLGKTMPQISGSIRGLAVRKEVKDQHPDRWQKLIDAYQKTLAKKDVQKFFKESAIGADWLGPEKTTQIVLQNYEILVKYKDLGK
jgi:tripartite-type tricarboxylate transporter receptor subunit TctC